MKCIIQISKLSTGAVFFAKDSSSSSNKNCGMILINTEQLMDREVHCQSQSFKLRLSNSTSRKTFINHTI